MSATELEQDRSAASEMDEHEAELVSETRALVSRVKTLEKRGRELRARLTTESLTPTEAVAFEGAIEDMAEDVADARRDLYRMVAHALGWRYSPADVQAWCREAVEMGAQHPQIAHNLISDLVRHRKVPNAPFRTRLAELTEHRSSELRDKHDKHENSLATITLDVYAHVRAVERETGVACAAGSLVVEKNGALVPQERELQRLLGIVPRYSSNRRRDGEGAPRIFSRRLFITYEQAIALARAFGMSPIDAGI